MGRWPARGKPETGAYAIPARPRRRPPRYAQLAALREEIISGRLRPGSRFPSGPDIEETYQVSHYTAERAVGTVSVVATVQSSAARDHVVVAALVHERQREITDTPEDLLISAVHRIGARAERKVIQ